MGFTKRQFITEAFNEIGLTDYMENISADALASVLKRLDSMMATWNGKGYRLFYPLSNDPTASNIDEDTRVPDWANEAIIVNLAVRIAPSFGKALSTETKQVAQDALMTLQQIFAQPIEKRLPREMPSGAGNKPWSQNNDPFVRQEGRQLEIGPDTFLEPL